MLLVLTRYYFTIIILIFGLSISFNHGYYRDIIHPMIENTENSNLNQRYDFAGDEEYDFPDQSSTELGFDENVPIPLDFWNPGIDYAYDSKVVMLTSLSPLAHPFDANFA